LPSMRRLKSLIGFALPRIAACFGLVISGDISRKRMRGHCLGARERLHVRDDTFIDI
jgi:hypothetical protein